METFNVRCGSNKKGVLAVSVFGILATIASLVIIVFGLPAQIIENHRRKSCDGINWRLVCSVLVAYFLWALYGWSKPDWFLVASQTPGFVLSLILFLQTIRYRKKPRNKDGQPQASCAACSAGDDRRRSTCRDSI